MSSNAERAEEPGRRRPAQVTEQRRVLDGGRRRSPHAADNPGAVAAARRDAVAMLPKQTMVTFRKHITEPSEQVAAPPSRWQTFTLPVSFCIKRRPLIVMFLTFFRKNTQRTRS